MEELLKEHKKYQYEIPTDNEFTKLKGEAKIGSNIEIDWIDREEIDKGYLFALPISQDENDLLFHIPNPDNSDGIGDAPPVWGHLNSLLKNKRVKQIRCIGGF